jgi:hypothetical protein
VAYTAPDLDELTARILRDLKDPDVKVFSTTQIEDFIAAGLAELNIERPREIVYELPNDDILTPDRDDLIAIPVQDIWMLEAVWTSTGGRETITYDDSSSGYPNGWALYAGNLMLPEAMIDALETGWTDDTVMLRIYGYMDRTVPEDPDDVLEFEDLQDEMALRVFTRLQGLRSLMDDRNLFTQWQTQANNSDVTPGQLAGMRSQAYTEWERMRGRIRRTPRTPINQRWA